MKVGSWGVGRRKKLIDINKESKEKGRVKLLKYLRGEGNLSLSLVT